MAANAYVLVNVDPPRTVAVLERLKGIPGAIVREVLGPYDIIVELEADTPEDVTALVRHKVRPVPGVTATVTCLWM
ncbi:MAG: Lrp/AsnC ligand binding domain-containing protein [Chloroflexi bacterium]|nr:Lrp/AsnC ligand binding domain-containing protein [Chloroflexota bacterium]